MPNGRVRDPIFEALTSDVSRFASAASPRRMELVGMSVVRDAGVFLLGLVPGVGDLVADLYGDNVFAEMRRRMTDQETETFTEVTRRWPDTIALVQTFQRLPGSDR